MRKDIDLIKETKDEKKIGEEVKNLIKQQSDNSFLLEGNIKFFQITDNSTQKDDFFGELQAIMKKYKVHFVVGNLVKKF